MCAWTMLIALGLAAQQPAALELVRGVLLDWDHTAGGQLTLRGGDNYVHLFGFDSRTRFERDGRPLSAVDLGKGDTLEIVVAPGATRPRRALVVRILTSLPPPPKPLPPPRQHFLYRGRVYTPTFDDLFPRGDLTFSGIVSRVEQDRLVLRTHGTGATSILLRPDTRYLRDGQQVVQSMLRVNTHVFIRGARNLDDELEAYSVMWGDIFKPN